jgi:hypothetical protein
MTFELMEDGEATVGETIDQILSFLSAFTVLEQIQFWTAFKEKHRERIGNTEAEFCPALLVAVDEQIARLYALRGRGE